MGRLPHARSFTRGLLGFTDKFRLGPVVSDMRKPVPPFGKNSSSFVSFVIFVVKIPLDKPISKGSRLVYFLSEQ